jgi:hypothetical protein
MKRLLSLHDSRKTVFGRLKLIAEQCGKKDCNKLERDVVFGGNETVRFLLSKREINEAEQILN